MEKYISFKMAAKLLNLNPKKVRALEQKGLLPMAVRDPKGEVKFDFDQLVDWIEINRQSNPESLANQESLEEWDVRT